MHQPTHEITPQEDIDLDEPSNKASSFYSVTREKEIDNLPSEDQMKQFDIKQLMENNQFDQNAFKILSLQLYKQNTDEKPKEDEDTPQKSKLDRYYTEKKKSVVSTEIE